MTLTTPSKKKQAAILFMFSFRQEKMEDFKRAFQEFASEKQGELTKPRAEITRQQIKDMAKQVSHEPKKKEKVREKSKKMTH